MSWTSRYPPVELGGTTLHRMVLEAAARPGDRPALVDGATGTRVTGCRGVRVSGDHSSGHPRSTEHRSQVKIALTQAGISPPELDGWTWDDERRGQTR